MKTVLAFVGLVAVAVGIWFLRGSTDANLLNAKNTEIAALQNSVQTSTQLADSRSDLIKTIQEKLKATEDIVTKDQAQIDAIQATLKKTQDTDQNIIASLKADREADIAALKADIQNKDDEIAELNEKLVQTIADYETKLGSSRSDVTDDFQGSPAPDDSIKIYPKDSGFDLQDVGTGFFSYRYFGESIRNPTNVEMPPKEPNQTPWIFTKDAGVAANGSGFYVNSATNGDSDGKHSTLGQAAFLEFKDSAVTQNIDLPDGTFSVTFSYEARMNYTANEIAVSIDGTVLSQGSPQATDHFVQVTTKSIHLSPGKHELKFLALGDGNDSGFPCTFIDDVSINNLSGKHDTKKTSNK